VFARSATYDGDPVCNNRPADDERGAECHTGGVEGCRCMREGHVSVANMIAPGQKPDTNAVGDLGQTVLNECVAAPKAFPNTPWVLHDLASMLLLAGNGSGPVLAQMHANGIQEMAAAITRARAINDPFTIDAGCRVLHVFRAANEPDCTPQLAANVRNQALAVIAKIRAQTAEMNEQFDEQTREAQSYQLMRTGGESPF
jgi:hypothetical protein